MINPSFMQTISQITIFIGIILTGLGGFGSYYYGKQVEKLKAPKIKNEIHQDIKIEHPTNSNITGNIGHQTNNYYQVPTSTTNNKKTKVNNKGNNPGLHIENMSGGTAIGNVENLNINLAKESIRETNGIYKNGEKWGVVKNININEKEKTFAIDEIDFTKSIGNTDEVFTPFEYGKFILKIIKIETLVTMQPPGAQGVSGIIVNEVNSAK